MEKSDNQVPAFPCQGSMGSLLMNPGMTLRDYFAAKAMQGMVARNGQFGRSVISLAAYEIADAMLEERKK